MADVINEKERDLATEAINARMPVGLMALLKGHAARHRTSVSHVLRLAVERYFTAPESRIDAEDRVLDAQAETKRWRELFLGLQEAFTELRQQHESLLAVKSPSLGEVLRVLTARIDALEADADVVKTVVNRHGKIIDVGRTRGNV
jgi:hypothetical protein